MQHLIDQIWDALLAGDLELANNLCQQLDNTIDISWFIEIHEEHEDEQ